MWGGRQGKGRQNRDCRSYLDFVHTIKLGLERTVYFKGDKLNKGNDNCKLS